eukprot:1119294-Alexandrium_andersonii.AAC.1
MFHEPTIRTILSTPLFPLSCSHLFSPWLRTIAATVVWSPLQSRSEEAKRGNEEGEEAVAEEKNERRE